MVDLVDRVYLRQFVEDLEAGVEPKKAIIFSRQNGVLGSIYSHLTVAGLAGALDNRSGAVVVEGMPVTVLEVDMLPRERGVEVVVVDAGEAVAGIVTDAETSAVSAAGFDPKSNGNPPLVESYAGGGIPILVSNQSL